MADFTIKRTDEMETIFDGIVHRAQGLDWRRPRSGCR